MVLLLVLAIPSYSYRYLHSFILGMGAVFISCRGVLFIAFRAVVFSWWHFKGQISVTVTNTCVLHNRQIASDAIALSSVSHDQTFTLSLIYTVS